MEYTVTFTQQEIQLINMALGELPMKMTLNLFGKIQQEIKRQDDVQAVPIAEIERQYRGEQGHGQPGPHPA